MLKSDRNQDLIDKLINTDNEFRKLYEEHVRFEQDLEALYSLKYMPPEVEARVKEIKIAKLQGKDRMMQIMAE